MNTGDWEGIYVDLDNDDIPDKSKCDEIKEEVMGLRKKLREAEQEKKNLSKSTSRSQSYYRRKRSESYESDVSKSKSATPPAETSGSEQSTVILSSSPASDSFPQTQPFSSPLSPAASLSEPQSPTDVGSDVIPSTQNLN